MDQRPNRFRRPFFACIALWAALAPLEAQALQIHRDSSAAAIGGAPSVRRKTGVGGAPRSSAGVSGGGRSLARPGVFGPHGRPAAPKAQ